MRLAVQNEDSLAIENNQQVEECLPTVAEWIAPVTSAYYNGQLVAVKYLRKSIITLNKTIIREVNQVL